MHGKASGSRQNVPFRRMGNEKDCPFVPEKRDYGGEDEVRILCMQQKKEETDMEMQNGGNRRPEKHFSILLEKVAI